MTIRLNYTFYKDNTKKQGIVHREFLIGGALSIDRLIEERASPYSQIRSSDIYCSGLLLIVDGK